MRCERGAWGRCWRTARVWVGVAVLAAAGCGGDKKKSAPSVSKPPKIQVIHPETRTIVRTVGQPSFIESYERTSIYPKLVGYIDKWNVDIGDKVKKGDVLAKLFIPELVEDYGTKGATVKLDEQRIALAKTMVDVAAADVKAAQAKLDETKAILGKYQAEADRWDTEVKRLTREVSRGVVDPQVLLESTNQFKSSSSARDAAKASILKAEADLLSKQATLAKANVDVSVAEADLAVATSDWKRVHALVGYITLSAPYDGVVVARNANTFDFVTPSAGDPTADSRSPDLSPSGSQAPIYVVDRTDVVRVFMDVPEQDANYVKIGNKATVMVRAFRDAPISGSVTRTSWALNVKSRTLRAEIDLPNTDSKLLPGMYAYAKVIVERPNVRALPMDALTHVGDRTYCWTYDGGHATRSEVETGVNDGKYVEVTNLQKGTAKSQDRPLEPINGSEQIIMGDLSILADGEKVEVAPEKEVEKGSEKVASASDSGKKASDSGAKDSK